MRKRIVCFLIVFLFAVVPSFSSAITFQIIQHDSVQSEIRNASYVVENTLFDYFFEHGYIVTNSQSISTFDDISDKEITYSALGDAEEGQCTYMVAIIIEYDTTRSFNPNATVLSNIKEIKWSLYNVSSGALMKKGSRNPGTVNSKRDNENGIKNFTRQIADDIFSCLKRR